MQFWSKTNIEVRQPWIPRAIFSSHFYNCGYNGAISNLKFLIGSINTLWKCSTSFSKIMPKFYQPINHFDHGLRTPNEAYFHWNTELLGIGSQIGQTNSGAFWVFSAKLILVQWVPCPCFPIFNHYFCKKVSLYIHISNIFLGFIWIWDAKN